MEPEVIELRLRELSALVSSLDPSPFHEKDLDRAAREYIIGRALELNRKAPLALVVYLDRSPPGRDVETLVRDAVHNDFAYQADQRRRELRQLLAVGRTSLAIGMLFLGACLAVSKLLAPFSENAFIHFFGESVVIGGWVAMWRPLEIFLYDWWPLARRLRLLNRLARSRVEVVRNPEPVATA